MADKAGRTVAAAVEARSVPQADSMAVEVAAYYCILVGVAVEVGEVDDTPFH